MESENEADFDERKENFDDMIISEIIERVDALRPNPFPVKDKIQWISELDFKIARDVLNKKDFKGYDYTSDEDKDVLLDKGDEDIYLFYLCAMIDFFSRDYGEYSNSIAMFNALFEKMAKRKHNENYENSSGDDSDGSSSGTKSSEYYKNIF